MYNSFHRCNLRFSWHTSLWWSFIGLSHLQYHYIYIIILVLRSATCVLHPVNYERYLEYISTIYFMLSLFSRSVVKECLLVEVVEECLCLEGCTSLACTQSTPHRGYALKCLINSCLLRSFFSDFTSQQCHIQDSSESVQLTVSAKRLLLVGVE